MYQLGCAKGVAPAKYGTANMTANEFATFCLRALKYNDAAGDFHYSSALKKMLELHLIVQEAYNIISAQPFTQDFAVKLAYSALFGEIKGTEKQFWQSDVYPEFKGTDLEYKYPLGFNDILINTLVRKGVINKALFESSILRIYDNLYFYTSKNAAHQLALNSEEEGTEIFYLKYERLHPKESLDITGLLPRYANSLATESANTNDYVSTYIRDTDNLMRYRIIYSDLYHCVKYFRNPGSVTLTAKEKQILDYAQKNFLDVYIKDGMSEYDKVLAAYEFTMNNIKPFSPDNTDSVLYNALINNKGLCAGYTRTFLFLANIMDIEAYSLSGTIYGESHAWNKVRIGDNYYNLDASWDDGKSRDSYTYFLLSDEYFKKSHSGKTGIDIIDEKIKATDTQYDPK